MIEVLVYVTATLLTYILGLISKKFKWNEQLPIPVQNIIVGLIVFTIVYIVQRPTDIQVALNEIMLALGGAGTATLGYDTKKIKED